MSAKPKPVRHLDPPTPVELWVKRASAAGADADGFAGADEVLVRSAFAPELHTNYGAPAEAWVRLVVPHVSTLALPSVASRL